MTAICIVCAFVCLFCTIFNAIVVKKLGKMVSAFFDMQDKLKGLSFSSSPLSGMGINLK